MGRTNKLVDGCYSYWQGALFPLLQHLKGKQHVQRAPRQNAQQQAAQGGAQEGQALLEAAHAVAAELLSGDEEEFVRGLRSVPPMQAAERELEARQKELDDLVDQSLQARPGMARR